MKKAAFIILLTLSIGLAGCSKPPDQAAVNTAAEASPKPATADSQDRRGIRTVKVEARALPDYFDVPAHIQAEPARIVRVFPPVGGRVVSVSVNPGDHVGKGETLAVLESSEVTAARADFQKARADAELKENSRQRASLLFENQVLAEKDYRQAVADVEMAQAELVRARDRLRILGVEPEGASNRISVPAPRAGVILDVGQAPGELSKSLDSPAPLCTIADLSTVWAVGDVYEKDLEGLAPGSAAEASFNAYPGEMWKGTVTAVSDVVDPGTRTLKVRVTLANPGWRLKPEMFGSIRLSRRTKQAIVVPSKAVLHDDSSTSIFVEKNHGRYERRLVKLGRTLDQDIEVISGLKPGEVVVADGAILLRNTAP